MRSRSALVSIIAHARSGALDHAWAMFVSQGYDAVRDDPAVLTVRGRLLKDRARAASGKARESLFRDAAAAYARAGELEAGATYPLINAATLSLLARDHEGARRLARQALALIDEGRDRPETPYYREATRAEALLLLGRAGEAQASLREAVAAAPRAWEDHASTLRQFALILDATGQESGWLDGLRPPRCLHYAGHMGVAEAAAEGDALAGRVQAVLEAERVGFGYGALAAGADIVIAEALLARGAELHLVLPGGPDHFRRASVEPAGGRWGARFDAALAAADTVRVIDAPSGAPLAPAIQVAAEAAMGCAVMQARTLATEPVQLLVVEPADEGAAAAPGGTAWAGAHWRAQGRRQQTIPAARSGAAASRSEAAIRATPAALLALRPGAGVSQAEGLRAVGRALAGAGETIGAPQWSAGVAHAAFATPAAAAHAALAAAEALSGADLRMAGHYGVVEHAEDLLGPGPRLLGPAIELPLRMLEVAPPGAAYLSGDFAAALNAAGGPGRTEYVGDLPSDEVDRAVGLYALRP